MPCFRVVSKIIGVLNSLRIFSMYIMCIDQTLELGASICLLENKKRLEFNDFNATGVFPSDLTFRVMYRICGTVLEES